MYHFIISLLRYSSTNDGPQGLRHLGRAGEGLARDAPPRDGPQAPEEARHRRCGGGGEGELGRRS